jgi:hypothetical protein
LNLFLLNSMIKPKWWPSIRRFSQIWVYIKYPRGGWKKASFLYFFHYLLEPNIKIWRLLFIYLLTMVVETPKKHSIFKIFI